MPHVVHTESPTNATSAPMLFADSVLALYLDEVAPAVFPFGRIVTLNEGSLVPAADTLRLAVVLEGRLVREANSADWYGPGNHFDHSVVDLAAAQGKARLWLLDLTAPEWRAPSNRALRLALTRALIAAEMAEADAAVDSALPNPETLCDADHPEIKRRAVRLRRATPADTAEAILRFVQQIPYRFGPWQERASTTLHRGVGMCTTKANLQVALLRAAGIEGGFVEMPIPMDFLGLLMPEGWLALQKTTVWHYHAAAKLGGRWHACDASFDNAALGIFLERFPVAAALMDPRLAEGQPYSAAAAAFETDPWEITVMPEIAHVMGKKSRFQVRHFEALNVKLDRARGLHRKRLAATIAEEARA